MKTLINSAFILVLFSTGINAWSQKKGTPDPAATYVHFLGYKTEIRKEPNGSEFGVVIFPDGSECRDWEFYRGICGKKYSYCTLKGCDINTKTENKGSCWVTYAVCSCRDSSGMVHDIPLNEFMEQHGDTLIKHIPGRKG